MGVLAGLFSGSMQTEVDGGGGFQHLLSLRCPLWGGEVRVHHSNHKECLQVGAPWP